MKAFAVATPIRRTACLYQMAALIGIVEKYLSALNPRIKSTAVQTLSRMGQKAVSKASRNFGRIANDLNEDQRYQISSTLSALNKCLDKSCMMYYPSTVCDSCDRVRRRDSCQLRPAVALCRSRAGGRYELRMV